MHKLHGNKRTLGDSLIALSAFLGGNDAQGNPPASYTLGMNTKVSIPQERKITLSNDQFAITKRKLGLLNDRLNAVGFVSFVN